MERKTGMTENERESVKCRIKRKKKNRMFRKSLGGKQQVYRSRRHTCCRAAVCSLDAAKDLSEELQRIF